ncbi:MAG: FAD-binding oxidoreductase [Gammaproteobacteria bacterium]|nr:FAD-binding oxidoreductase [Gammaproteobacteria bacterium]
MRSNADELISYLADIVGPRWVKTESVDLNHYGKDWTNDVNPNPSAIVFPASIEEIKLIVALANKKKVALVPSGGRTGLSGGALAENSEVVVSFDRMNKILEFNAEDRLITCEPGVTTKTLQEYAEEKELYYPVDFASSGSSQLGGNVATNAGGIKVIRYGMTRNWVQGMKVVTGEGQLLDLNRGLVKNASGLDFRHLFIGSEGTLGFIIELTIGLSSLPKGSTVILVGLNNMIDTMTVLEAFRNKLTLNAFEFFSDKALAHVVKEHALQKPFDKICEFYALIEFENTTSSDLDTAQSIFEHCFKCGLVVNGTISQSSREAKKLWRFREDITSAISKYSPYKNDISVRISQVPSFLSELDELIKRIYPSFETLFFGHIGDGNIHLNIVKPAGLTTKDFYKECEKVTEMVFGLVQKFGGSVSAEHGIGVLKKPYLRYSRSKEEITYMKAVKRIFDPNNIMNPGKLVDIN